MNSEGICMNSPVYENLSHENPFYAEREYITKTGDYTIFAKIATCEGGGL